MMFVGMTFCLPLAYWVDSRKAAKKEAGEDASSPLLGDDDDGPVRCSVPCKMAVLLHVQHSAFESARLEP